MITNGKRTQRWQGLPTMEMMINLRAKLLQELKSEEEQKSCYMREVQNYLHKFWKEAFTYIKDDWLSDLEQFGEASDASLYHQMEELPALRK